MKRIYLREGARVLDTTLDTTEILINTSEQMQHLPPGESSPTSPFQRPLNPLSPRGLDLAVPDKLNLYRHPIITA